MTLLPRVEGVTPVNHQPPTKSAQARENQLRTGRVITREQKWVSLAERRGKTENYRSGDQLPEEAGDVGSRHAHAAAPFLRRAYP